MERQTSLSTLCDGGFNNFWILSILCALPVFLTSKINFQLVSSIVRPGHFAFHNGGEKVGISASLGSLCNLTLYRRIYRTVKCGHRWDFLPVSPLLLLYGFGFVDFGRKRRQTVVLTMKGLVTRKAEQELNVTGAHSSTNGQEMGEDDESGGSQ